MTKAKHFAATAAIAMGAAGLLLATPAQASINDQYNCERNTGGSLVVELRALEPGTAVLYDWSSDAADPVTIELTGEATEDGFRYSNGGTVFEGSGFDATLDYRRASFICTMPMPQELYDAALEQRILLDGHGLTVLRPERGFSARLPFGSSEAESIAMLEDLFGAPGGEERNDECPVGPLTFRDFGALNLHYQDGNFAGWSMNEGAFYPTRVSLPNGSHIDLAGDALPDWMEPMEGSTLGDEHYGDGVHAMLDEENGTITHLWGGASCVFR